MKKRILSAFLFVAVTAAAMAFAAVGDPKTGVVGSVHDMRNYGGSTNDPQDRVCAYCHTPHHAATTGNDYLPLWSHTVSTEALSPYWSATLQAQITPGDFLMGPSKLCMSCHDGSIAVDQHYNIAGTKKLAGDNFLQPAIGDAGGSTLTNDHPIGFVYNDVAAGAAGVPGTSVDVTKDNYINASDAALTYKGNTAIKVQDRLFDTAGYMTCATCHDVHNKKNADLTGTQNYLVLAPQSGSQLCLTCHIK